MMYKFGFLLLSLILFKSAIGFADFRAHSCDLVFRKTMPFKGDKRTKLIPLAEIKDNIEKVHIHKGRLTDKNKLNLNVSSPHQFVIDKDLKFLVTKKPDEVDHTQLGRGKFVYFAGLIVINEGVIIELVMLESSAYKGSLEKMYELIQFFKNLKLDLSQVTISMAFSDFIVDSVSIDEFLDTYTHSVK